ncbi:DMT family transporter [Pendulispora brunnea]|uniref:DMT family transporter n=1 Tax=Pendulispora brunnea TaxID=2905690 RepID=A0ABZ2KE57_9BACT
MDTTESAGRKGTALMVAGGAVLGTVGVFVEQAGQAPFTAVWFRCAFGATALWLWGALRNRNGELWLRGRALAAAIATGLLMTANWALFFAALDRTSIAVATVVFHVQPVWVMAAGVLWLGETFSRIRALATALALAGLVLATGLLEDHGTVSASYVLGLLMCLGGSLAYAAVTLIAKTAAGASSFALAWWQCVVGAIALAWWPLAHGLPAFGAAWGWLAGLGVIHTGLAYVLLYAGMSLLPASRIAVLQFVYPGCAVAMDWLVYGRALSAAQMVGMLLIGVAQFLRINRARGER